MSAVDFWKGKFGDEYQARNDGDGIGAREGLWYDILAFFPHRDVTGKPQVGSMLEIGAGCGNNLSALSRLGEGPLCAVEPNRWARAKLKDRGLETYDGTAATPGRSADLVFTSGVLIHVPPEGLLAACQGIYDASTRYIVSIEYFADEPEEKLYRGHAGKLWKRDFGGFWLDNFQLSVLGCGFAWKRTTGLDNLTWWAFSK